MLLEWHTKASHQVRYSCVSTHQLPDCRLHKKRILQKMVRSGSTRNTFVAIMGLLALVIGQISRLSV